VQAGLDGLPGVSGPLRGIRVADFSRVLAGPLAAMMLGDLGAEVIKVERPGAGDETRSWRPPTTEDGQSTYFLAVNRNKRSIALDLSTSEGQISARELALSCDVVVENFAPGTMERYGLGYASLSETRPDLIYGSVTGFGREAGASLPGYDFLVQAVGGLMSITGPVDGEPTKVGVAVVDVLAGNHLATGIIAALYHRDRTGIGQRVDVNLLSSQLFGLVNQGSAFLNAGVVPTRMGNAHPSIAPYQTLATADRPIAVAVGNDAQFQRLASALTEDVPEMASLSGDDRFTTNHSRVQHANALTAELEARLRTHPAAHWVSRLTTANVPCGLVQSIEEGFALAESLGLDPVVRQITSGGHSRASVAFPARFSATPPSYRLPPPE
jgi:crotonobetainyl-CoA:carnitine CoA-transferase CaiB-like acyl-CoA transferase